MYGLCARVQGLQPLAKRVEPIEPIEPGIEPLAKHVEPIEPLYIEKELRATVLLEYSGSIGSTCFASGSSPGSIGSIGSTRLRAIVIPASMRLCASLGEMLAIVGISVQSRSLSMDCTSGAGHTGSSLGSGL